MLIDLPCSRCGHDVWLTWSDYLDAVSSDSPRRNWPYVCRACTSPHTRAPLPEDPPC
jgi:hypothetical protein